MSMHPAGYRHLERRARLRSSVSPVPSTESYKEQSSTLQRRLLDPFIKWG